MKIKIFLSVIVLTALLVCCACSPKPSAPGSDPSDPSVSAPSEKDPADETGDRPSDMNAVPFQRGTRVGRVYQNELLSLSFTPAFEWELSDDIILADLMGIPVTEMRSLSLDTREVIYDFYAYDTESDSDVVISFERIDLSEAAYADQTRENLQAESTVYTVGENYTATIAGLEYTCFRLSAPTSDGAELSQTYCLHKLEDGTMAEIVVTVIGTSSEEIFSWFSELQ